MSKEAYYFSHDSNAREDEKILELRMKYGWAGYGLYWAIVEMLRDATAFKMKLDYKRIAFALQSDENIVKSIVSDFDLFIVDNEFFWSESLMKRMQIKEAKSDKARKAALKRWGKIEEIEVVDNQEVNAYALHEHCDSNAIKGKESKVKEIYRESDFLQDWKSARSKIDGKPTNIKQLDFIERQNFKRLQPEFTQDQFRQAIQGLFMQKGMIPTTRVRPKHFLNDRNIEKYLDAFTGSTQLYTKTQKL